MTLLKFDPYLIEKQEILYKLSNALGIVIYSKRGICFKEFGSYSVERLEIILKIYMISGDLDLAIVDSEINIIDWTKYFIKQPEELKPLVEIPNGMKVLKVK